MGDIKESDSISLKSLPFETNTKSNSKDKLDYLDLVNNNPSASTDLNNNKAIGT